MRRLLATRLPVFALAALLAFKAAVPMLAAAAAMAQGKATAEICSVWGVVVPPSPGDVDRDPHAHHQHDHHGHDDGAHHGDGAHQGADGAEAAPASPAAPHETSDHRGGDHCALTALAALAAAFDAATVLPARQAAGPDAHRSAEQTRPRLDSAARWAALLGHGPPAFS